MLAAIQSNNTQECMCSMRCFRVNQVTSVANMRVAAANIIHNDRSSSAQNKSLPVQNKMCRLSYSRKLWIRLVNLCGGEVLHFGDGNGTGENGLDRSRISMRYDIKQTVKLEPSNTSAWTVCLRYTLPSPP
mmetsp:Transcript_15042/g.28966  ORF Transcript_15042/g.28966 Transcript_15042/m.28966 type:complete len:131 (+) Transcript_15042:361-753(+)